MSTSSDVPDGYSATDYPNDLQQRAEADPDRPPAREVQDPHRWERAKPTLVERVTPGSTSGWIAFFGVAAIVGALLYYLLPVFGNFLTNPLVMAAVLFVSYTTAAVIIGRRWMLSDFKALDKSIIHYGDSADIRLGEGDGVEGRSTVFSPYKNLKWAGLRTIPLYRTELPYDASKLKQKNDPDEREPVNDLLNQSTVEVNTDTFGTVYVTHAADLDYYENGSVADRYATPPNTIDEDVAEDFRMELQRMNAKIQETKQRIEMLEKANKELQDIPRKLKLPQLEESMEIMDELSETMAKQRGERRATDTTQQVAAMKNGGGNG